MPELNEQKWCNRCKAWHPVHAFRLRKKTGRRYCWCIPCFRTYTNDYLREKRARVRGTKASRVRSKSGRIIEQPDKKTTVELNLGPPIPIPDGIELRYPDGSAFPCTRIDPASYFVSSGDGVQKLLQLQEDLRVVALQLDPEDDRMRPIRKLLLRAGVLMTKFVKIRGGAVFLETEWTSSGRLTVCAKNPRARREGQVGTLADDRHRSLRQRKPEQAPASGSVEMDDDSVDVLGEVGLVLVGNPD